ncbi:hypothetical protein [Streptomyces sp. NPDC047009]|uniref:hypothetical protein n=1 Tax=Streptomyces sp. NPDC047009 TaxID=3154496 RepID=UPI0033FDC71E
MAAALQRPVPAYALDAGALRRPVPTLAARVTALGTKVWRDIQDLRAMFVSRLKALPLALSRGSEPACFRVGQRRESAADGTAAARLRTALTTARELVRGLVAAHRARFPARIARAVNGTQAGAVPQHPPRRRRPDATP